MADDTETRELKDASTNPWYVLMTIAGEQNGWLVDPDLHDRNRRYWNGWAGAALSEARKAELIDKHGFTAEDFAPLTEKETNEIRRQLRERAGTEEILDPSDPVDCRKTRFLTTHCCAGFAFPRYASFEGAAFSWYADFEGAAFDGYADFEGAAFSKHTNFWRATFLDRIFFSGATLSGPTRFSGARFEHSPLLLYNAELHEDTDLNVAAWPRVPERHDAARVHLRAYERLKLLMANQKKHADEHMFLRKELACREVVEENRAIRLGYTLFRLSCDSGWDPVRPISWLGIAWLLGWLLIGGSEYYDATHLAWPEGCDAAGTCPEKAPLGFFQSGALSFSNIFGFLGLRTTFMREELASLNSLSEVVSGAQMFAGPILLFLMGLALRNRFRLS
ncbi:MAG: pentapeptide repeat-containing protein [Pseudomonadota bacterium]